MKKCVNLQPSVSLERERHESIACPNCLNPGLTAFFTVHSIPVHSCRLMTTQAEALQMPVADLVLGHCSNCGFITNMCFDPSHHRYADGYESTQGFSPRFNRFAEALAQHVIDRYDLRDKTIVEIGCGHGEFLQIMCELGPNRGIGIDPAFLPERRPGTQDLEFIQDFYSKKYTHLQADVLCCRHTLEHIPTPHAFMTMIRNSIAPGRKPLIFFEVPDVYRILSEGAFWDIYYEHCTYFTSGSLARLFRSTRFDIDELTLDFNDQYIVINGYPAETPAPPQLPLEDDLLRIERAVMAFRDACARRMAHWTSVISEASQQNQRVVLWGSGSKAVSFLTTLEAADAVEYVVDINPYKHGRFMPKTGQQIMSPEFLKTYDPQWIIAMNPIYQAEIRKTLDGLGIRARLLAV